VLAGLLSAISPHAISVQYATALSDFNFEAAGDWGNSTDGDDAAETADNMATHGVELALLLGDFSYESSSSAINSWWNNDMAPLHGISKAALGNHDDDSSTMMSQYHSLFELADEDPDKDFGYTRSTTKTFTFLH
jgi:hypothetical protein